MTHVESTRTLLLTQGYEPIQIISWQRAVTLLALDKVEVVEEYDALIRAASIVVNVPAVVPPLKTSPDAPERVPHHQMRYAWSSTCGHYFALK